MLYCWRSAERFSPRCSTFRALRPAGPNPDTTDNNRTFVPLLNSQSFAQRPPSDGSPAAQSLSNTTPPEPGGTTVTVTVALPLWPSLVAVIVAGPATSPVTVPLPLTPAIVGLFELHVTTRPVRVFPLASLSVAVNCWTAPTATLALAGLTVTDATGAVEAAVVPLATFDSGPNTALESRVPRYETSCTW